MYNSLFSGETAGEVNHMNELPFGSGVPMGFGMALVQDQAALAAFSDMTDAERRAVLARVSGIRSRDEMRAYVASLAGGDGGAGTFSF